MRMALAVCSLLMVTIPAQVVGDSRNQSAADTARHPTSDVRVDKPGGRNPDHKRPVVVPRPDPAIEHFWSDRCVRQRRSGMGHTKDCDNPAYTGGGYRPDTDPYPRFAPYGAYGYRPYGFPPGGGIVRDNRAVPGWTGYRGWNHDLGGGRPGIPR